MPAPILWRSEFRVNTFTDGDQEDPSFSALKDGGFVAVWTSQNTVCAQLFYADGTKRGEQFIAISPKDSSLGTPEVTVLSDGRFVIACEKYTNDDGYIQARVFSSTGAPIGDDFTVSIAEGIQSKPAIAADAKGGFIITYNSSTGDGSNEAILARTYTADLQAGAETLVNGTTFYVQQNSRVTALANGNYAVMYEDGSVYPSYTIRGRIVGADGTPLANISEFTVPADLSEAVSPSVTALVDGSMVVVWQEVSSLSPSSSNIMGRIFNADGTARGGEFQVNTTSPSNQVRPVVTALADGGFAVAFKSQTSKDQELRLVAFSSSGDRSEEILVSSSLANSLHELTLTSLSDGRLVVGWMDYARPDDPEYTVRGQIVDPRTRGVMDGEFKGTSSDDQYVGTQFGDVIASAAGADRMWGESGNDTLDGGAGADILDGGEGFDFVSFASSAAGVTASLRGATGDGTGDTWISIEGIIGSSHADTFNGNGATQFQGGAGNDTYQVTAGDSVAETAGGGRDTVLASSSYALAAGSDVEVLQLWGVSSRASYTLTGSDTANEILGHAGTNTLMGQGGHDVLKASLGNDRVYGGTGNDRIHGGEGNDRLYGETGRDIFVFDTRLNKRTNVDKIFDFRTRDDSIYLENQYFTKLGSGTASRPKKFKSDMFVESNRAQDAEDRIIYDRKSGALYYDKDGTGSTAQVKIATVSNKTKLYYHDFFVI